MAVAATLGAASGDAEKTRVLVATLQDANAAVFERARACQQLAIVGTAEAIPVLAAQLTEGPLAHYAREALEAMATPAADAALRAAVARAQGATLIGLVNTLGMRRDAQAVALLVPLARDAASPAAGAAFLALARIGGAEAWATVRMGLTQGPAPLRGAAAEAALLLADELVRAGKGTEAAGWCDAVRAGEFTAQLSLSALRGAILARGAAGIPLLLATLRSERAEEREVALRAIRESTAAEVTPALVAELERFSPATRAALLGALVDRGEAHAVPAIERAVAAADADVRIAALRALGRIGGASSVPLLLAAVRADGAGESEAAQRSLVQVPFAGADAAILAALPGATTATKVKLIAILGERGAASAAATVIGLARDSDAAVSRAALRAAGLLARPADLPALIAVAATRQEDDARTLADRAIYAAAMKILEPEKRAEPVVRAVREARDPATRAALLRPMGAVVRAMGGNAEARAVAVGALKEHDASVRTAAAKVLADWPDATAAPALLEFLREQPDAAQRGVVFDGAVRLVAEVAAGKDKTALEVGAALAELNAAARTDEERMKIVGALGSWRRIEAFRMLQPYLDVTAVRTEAALAVVQIAPALLGGSEGAAVKAVLQQIAETEKDADVKAKAARVLRGGAAEAAKKGKAKKG
jgi:HEAT repeat protein